METAFSACCDYAFEPILMPCGFVHAARKAEKYLAWHVYRNGERYIEVTASTHPRDYPSSCQLYLGEGTLEWPESDWNRVALGYLRAARPAPKEYLIPADGQLGQLMRQMATDLQRDATDFLAGDLHRFYLARAMVVQARSPYVIYQPDGEGGYSRHDDPHSAALRERFSKPW